MIPATIPVQRPADAKLLVVDNGGVITHHPRRYWLDSLRRGDLVIANDAATIPASLSGRHLKTGLPIEIRLAARRSLSPTDVECFSAVAFGAGDFRTPTERWPLPPAMDAGDILELGPLRAAVTRTLGHPRLVDLHFAGTPDTIWAGLARHGRPIQYSHLVNPLALWDVWTVVAGPPVAFEPPSAGFVLDWQTVLEMRRRSIQFATLTHAAGISSTGDETLDARLPFDEPYRIPSSTARLVEQARRESRRIVAIGTTVVRALEHSAGVNGRVVAGEGMATQKITDTTMLVVVDALLSGVHEHETSHYRLLGAFADQPTLERADLAMNSLGYRNHEFGDSVLIERRPVSTLKRFAEDPRDRAFASARP
jgi:S-adenosylmethionine:tRNA ribosyltransferase-isomerase